jgi:SAM-dependent methyltransferase
MTTIANNDQFEAWNGDSGHRWVARADQRDRVLAPVAEALVGTAAPTPGARVLDVGCGCGATTLAAAARVGDTGSASGIDLSGPMLAVARQRASAARAVNTTFVQGDAQTHRFAPGSADLVISRFGTMFFSDPEAAFANIATALVPGGRLCLATWRPLEANEWLAVPGAALLRHTVMPATTNEPGMFAQSDPDVVTATLHGAGFEDITMKATDVTFDLGRTLEGAVEYLADSGPGRLMLDSIPQGPARDAALADVRDALVDHQDTAGVRLGGGVWLVTAIRSVA